MVELKIYLPDSLNERFRRIAMSVYGYGRGSLSKAAGEAFIKWCSEHEPPQVHKNETGPAEAAPANDSKTPGSHVDPDERENAVGGATENGGNMPSRPIRPDS